MNIFYQTDLSKQSGILNEEESRHTVKVLRLSKGDVIYLIDGKGTFCKAVINDPNPRGCKYDITQRTENYGKKKYSLTLAIAPTKNIDRFEWFLEKATEIGIDQIIPIICRYSERRDLKIERLEKVIISAVKQSQKAYLPLLSPATHFYDLINKSFEGDKFIAHCVDEEKHYLKNLVKPERDTLICIGPEGDFSTDEIKTALNNGFLPVSLGDSRLRTETAGVVACHTVNLINQ